MIASETNLFAEVHGGGLSFFFLNNAAKKITGLSVFNFENGIGEEIIADNVLEIFKGQGLLNTKFNKTYISYSYPECIVTPALYYNRFQNGENLDLIYGDLKQGIVLVDNIQENNLYNVYRVPPAIHTVLTNSFADITFMHQYSSLLRDLDQAPNLLKIIFYANKIVMLLHKEDNLQLLQTFNYVTAGDVVYNALNACSRFSARDIEIELCGIVERNSARVREISQYFSTITFAELPAALSYEDKIKELPHHFFSHLFSFALCV